MNYSNSSYLKFRALTNNNPLQAAQIKRYLILVLIGLWGFASAVSAQESERSRLITQLDSTAKAHGADSTVAGIVVAALHQGDTLLHKGYGKANLEFDVTMPKDAVFEIASITKHFTAAAILHLAEKDSIELDADITEYLPDYNTRGHQVTVRQLLYHTSGIRGIFLTVPRSLSPLTRKQMPRDTVFTLMQQEPFRFAPGTAMSYSNTGYHLLGFIIEAVSGQTYGEYLQQNLLTPAGMENSTYCGDERTIIEKGAGGYSWEKEFRKAPHHDNSWGYASGGLCSTAGDLIRWTKALHGGQILSDRLYEEMISPGHLSDGTELRYAMGLRHRRPGGHRTLQHSGRVPGFLSHLRYYRDEDLTVVVLQNTTSFPFGQMDRTPQSLTDSLAHFLLGEKDMTEQSSYEGELTELTGRYSGPAANRVLEVEVRERNGRLLFSEVGSKEEVELEHRSGLTWTRDTEQIEEHYTFVRKGGEIIELRIDKFHNYLILRRVGSN